jgi:hypothetical protein
MSLELRASIARQIEAWMESEFAPPIWYRAVNIALGDNWPVERCYHDEAYRATADCGECRGD